MRSASCRQKANTCWSSRRTACSIWVRSSVFMLSFVNCAFNSPTPPDGSWKSLARTFEQDAIEDFDLIKVVTFGFEELPALIDRCVYDRIVVFGEGYVGAIRFEQILVNMKARPKRFECGFQPLYCVFLL